MGERYNAHPRIRGNFRHRRKRSKRTKSLLLALVMAANFWQPVFARPRSALDTQLVEGAKQEGKMVFYTTMDLPQTILVVHDFVQKYPFLGFELHPLEAESLVKKVKNEAGDRMPGWDVLIGGGGLFQPLIDENLLASYHSPHRVAITDALV